MIVFASSALAVEMHTQETCIDEHTYCADWATINGECQKTRYMLTYCKKSFDVCTESNVQPVDEKIQEPVAVQEPETVVEATPAETEWNISGPNDCLL